MHTESGDWSAAALIAVRAVLSPSRMGGFREATLRSRPLPGPEVSSLVSTVSAELLARAETDEHAAKHCFSPPAVDLLADISERARVIRAVCRQSRDSATPVHSENLFDLTPFGAAVRGHLIRVLHELRVNLPRGDLGQFMHKALQFVGGSNFDPDAWRPLDALVFLAEWGELQLQHPRRTSGYHVAEQLLIRKSLLVGWNGENYDILAALLGSAYRGAGGLTSLSALSRVATDEQYWQNMGLHLEKSMRCFRDFLDLPLPPPACRHVAALA